MGVIKWEYTYTVIKNCKRLSGTGPNHKFVIVEFDKNIPNSFKGDYVGYIKSNITDEQETWKFVKDGINETEIFIKEIKQLIERKDKKAG